MSQNIEDPVIIRMMEEGDLEEAAKLEAMCFLEPWSLKLLKDSFQGPWDTLFVAEKQDELCGYMALRILAGEGELQRIAVYPEYRRQGIASKLMEKMDIFFRANGVGDATLEVRAGNQAALNLYKSYGFAEEGIRKGYYRNPTEDAVIMWRRSP